MNYQERLDAAWAKIQGGTQQIDEGQAGWTKGRELVTKGNELIAEGKKLVAEGNEILRISKLLWNQGREAWIEGTLELAQILADIRNSVNTTHDFTRTLREMGYGENRITAIERQALVRMAKCPGITRQVLEHTKHREWENIWRFDIKPLSVAEETRKAAEAEAAKKAEAATEAVKKYQMEQEALAHDNTVPDNMAQEFNEVAFTTTLGDPNVPAVATKPMTPSQKARARDKAEGWEVKVEGVYRRVPPTERMPDNILEEYDTALQHALGVLRVINELNEWREQMHYELRHYLASGLLDVRNEAEKLARTVLGEGGDLRKVMQFRCDAEIQVRAEAAEEPVE